MLLFRLLLALITLVAMLSLAIVFYTTGQVDSASRQATDKSETALMAAESSEKLRDLLDILSRRVQSYQASAEFLALTPEMQETVRVEIARAVDDPPNPATSGAVVPLSLNETSAFQTTLEYLFPQFQWTLPRESPSISYRRINYPRIGELNLLRQKRSKSVPHGPGTAPRCYYRSLR